MKSPNVVNIDLYVFFRSLLEQWKCVAAVAVITAILIPVALSLKDNRDAKSEADNLVGLASMSDEEKMDRLSESQREKVVYALNQARLIEAQENYDANSLVAAMDEGNLPVLHYSWVVSGTSDTVAVSAAYRLLLEAPETSDVVRTALAPSYQDIEDVYVDELINVESNDAVDMYVILPEGTDVEALKTGIDARIKDIQKSLEAEFGKHEVHLISSEEAFVTDADRIAERILTDDNLKTLKNNYDSLRQAMSDEQLTILDIMLTGSSDVQPYVDPGISFSAGRAAIGFGVGLILYVFCYFVFFVFSSKMRSSAVLSETYGIRELGTTSKYTFKGLVFFAHCMLIYKAFRKDTVDGKSLDAIADAINTSVKHNDCSKVLFVRSGISKNYYDLADKLVSKIKKSGAQVKCIDTLPKDSDIADHDSVVVCAGYAQTKYSDISDIASVCDHYGKKIIGGVWFD